MNRFVITFTVAAVFASVPAHADNLFSGDKRLACEALLCLAASASGRPSECAKAIKKYFSIIASKPWETFSLRLDFLNLCPSESPGLASAIANGAGRCDASALNTLNAISAMEGGMSGITQLPDYCTTFYGHDYMVYAREDMPIFYGDPDRGGMWVDPANLDAFRETYDQRINLENQCYQSRSCTSPGCKTWCNDAVATGQYPNTNPWQTAP